MRETIFHLEKLISPDGEKLIKCVKYITLSVVTPLVKFYLVSGYQCVKYSTMSVVTLVSEIKH